MADSSKETNLKDYVELSITDLRALKHSYEDKIDELERAHWINKVQPYMKFNIRKLLASIGLIILVFVVVVLLIFLPSQFFKLGNPILSSLMSAAIASLFLLIPLYGALDDRTGELYKEVRKIDIVLKNKMKPDTHNLPNHKMIFIIQILAETPQGLNRGDLIRLMKERFGKSIDPKTVDKYLKELEYAIKIDEKPYKSKFGNDYSRTKIYSLKTIRQESSGNP